MTVMNIREAINATIHAEMERDPSIVVLGEDIVGGNGTAGGPEAIGGICLVRESLRVEDRGELVTGVDLIVPHDLGGKALLHGGGRRWRHQIFRRYR